MTNDCVSRQATLNAIIKELCIKDESYLLQSEKAIYNVVKNMPPVTPTQRWIPISERLPKEGETVLVCYQTQGGVSQSVCEWFDMPNSGIVWSTLCGQKPIAWQPLPKAYEEK